MHVSSHAIALIQKFEGLRTKAYKPFPHDEYYELLEHCLGSLEQVKSKGWSRTEPAPIF